jgi:hypothetical protein
MKDTYWLVIASFGIVALGLWVGMILARRRMERLAREGPFRLPAARSIWTRELFDTLVGRLFFNFVLVPFILASGFIDIVNRHARWKYFDYWNFDAICIGVGEIGIGVALMATGTFSERDYGKRKFRTTAMVAGFTSFVVGFSAALFRNI